jgi:hypothetical protein
MKKSAPRRRVSRVELAPSASSSTRTTTVLRKVRPHWPAISDADREAFDSLATDAQRAEKGGRTRAPRVLAEALAWVTQVDGELRANAALHEFYTPTRFVYFLERVALLDTGIEADRTRGTSRAASRTTADGARSTAVAARTRLERRLERFAGRRDAENAEIDAARGQANPDDALRASLVDLALVAERFLARRDHASVILARNAGLTEAVVHAARLAAHALVEGAADATLAGPGASKDSPAVNIAEGAVLLEMDAAMHAFDEAHDEHPAIKRLTPGPATRGVLGNRHAAKKLPTSGDGSAATNAGEAGTGSAAR